MPKTTSEKIWDNHLVVHEDGKPDLLYIDLHLVHEVTSAQAFEGLRLAGRRVRRPDLTLATVDHNVPTKDRDLEWPDPLSTQQVRTLRENCEAFGVPMFDVRDTRQGIVHIIGPEQGLTQPGMTIVCGDSHTSTHGAFGALAIGIGTSEVEHVLATQTLPQARPKTMSVDVSGELHEGVTAKDVILAIIRQIGVSGGIGHVIEYRGDTIRRLSMEGRMTVCNMSIEGGARAGLVAPDDTTFAYVEGRPHAPKGAEWERALDAWRALPSDDDATFDTTIELRARRHRAVRDVGDDAGTERAGNGPRAGPGELHRLERARARRAFADIHGPARWHGDRGHRARPCVPRLLHERPHRRPARGGGHRARPQGGARRSGRWSCPDRGL